MPGCSLFSRSKIHFWLITNALRSARANVFVECQLMLSDKCLKLSQGSCPSFRLCQMSPLVEEDNSYTGGDWAVCSLKGLTLPYGATIRWRKECGCFNWNFTHLNFSFDQKILVSTNLHSGLSILSDYNYISSVLPISLLRMNVFSNIVLSVFWDILALSVCY